MPAKVRVMLIMTAVAWGSFGMTSSAQADILNNWFGPQYVAYRPIFPRRTVVVMSPTVAMSPVATGCNTCASTTVGFAPPASTIAAYAHTRTIVGYAPYTSFRPMPMAVPVTAFSQPTTSFFGGCSSCGVRTAAFAAPACATGGCATGNCGVNYGGSFAAAPTSGCSTCNAGSTPMSTPNYTPSYSAQPGSSFAPSGADHVHSSVPNTTPEPQTQAPQIAPQVPVPQTQLENYPPQSGAANGPTLPMSFREPASQQPISQLQPVPSAPAREAQEGSRALPRLVNPQDKTAHVNPPAFTVQPAVYTSEAPSYQSVVVTNPAENAPARLVPVPTASNLSQEQLDAEGWGPAKR